MQSAPARAAVCNSVSANFAKLHIALKPRNTPDVGKSNAPITVIATPRGLSPGNVFVVAEEKDKNVCPFAWPT